MPPEKLSLPEGSEQSNPKLLCPSNHKTDDQTERPHHARGVHRVYGKCGREVPKTMYCIYCGSPLSEQDKKSKTRFAERKSRGEGVDLFRPEQAPDIPEPKFFRIPPYGHETRTETLRVREVDLDSDTVQLLWELRKYQKWKLRLCGLLADNRVSGEVFRKIYG